MQLEKVRIGHDGRGLGTGWYLEEVMIIIHDECWIFPCNRWLADYEDDGKTERDLYAGQFLKKMEKRILKWYQSGRFIDLSIPLFLQFVIIFVTF